MEPLSMVATALASGALAKAGDIAGTAVSDAYAALKQLIADRYAQSRQASDKLEADPTSESVKADVVAKLDAERAGNDAELLEKAEAVTAALAATPADRLRSVGLDLTDVKAANVKIRSLRVNEGTGLRMTSGDIVGDLEIGDVEVGDRRPN